MRGLFALTLAAVLAVSSGATVDRRLSEEMDQYRHASGIVSHEVARTKRVSSRPQKSKCVCVRACVRERDGRVTVVVVENAAHEGLGRAREVRRGEKIDSSEARVLSPRRLNGLT